MKPDPFQGRWTPGPDAAEIALLQKKQYAAVIVWRAMLRDALRRPDWTTKQSLAHIQNETMLSRPTIIKAQAQLLAAGYIQRLDGGGASRRAPTYRMRKPKNFGEKVQLSTENWSL